MKYTYNHKMKRSFFSCSLNSLDVSLLFCFSESVLGHIGAGMAVEVRWNLVVTKQLLMLSFVIFPFNLTGV